MSVSTNFIEKEKLRRDSLAQSAEKNPPLPAEKTDLRQVADELSQQHLDWAKRRPKDYKVPY